MATRDLRSYFTSVSKDKKVSHGSCTSIPQLAKATGNVTAADASAMISAASAKKAMILSGFRAAGISEAMENAKSITEKVKNPFKEL